MVTMVYKLKVIILLMFLSVIDFAMFANADDYQEVINTYGKDNLADKPPFQGGILTLAIGKIFQFKMVIS